MYIEILHDSKVFLLLNVLYRNKARFFKASLFRVAKSNANRNSYGLLKYFDSIHSYLESSNAGQQRTKEKAGVNYIKRKRQHFKTIMNSAKRMWEREASTVFPSFFYCQLQSALCFLKSRTLEISNYDY